LSYVYLISPLLVALFWQMSTCLPGMHAHVNIISEYAHVSQGNASHAFLNIRIRSLLLEQAQCETREDQSRLFFDIMGMRASATLFCKRTHTPFAPEPLSTFCVELLHVVVVDEHVTDVAEDQHSILLVYALQGMHETACYRFCVCDHSLLTVLSSSLHDAFGTELL
jgi:hypothetical protein